MFGVKTTAWMGGLPRNTTCSEIMDHFKDYNPVSCKIIKKPGNETYSFILFESEKDRNDAINNLATSTFKGIHCHLNYSYNRFYDTQRVIYDNPQFVVKRRNYHNDYYDDDYFDQYADDYYNDYDFW